MAVRSLGFVTAVLGWTPAYLTFTDVLFSIAAIDGRCSAASLGQTLCSISLWAGLIQALMCSSMQPALNPTSGEGGERVLTDKLSIHLYKFQRGDVVTLR